MRIISQDGTIDVSYENGSLVIGVHKSEDVKGAGIYYHNSSSPRGTKLAKYSSKEKAIKAMEMLREAYMKIEEFNGGYDMNDCYVSPEKWVLPKVFQFPKDEDLEVEDE